MTTSLLWLIAVYTLPVSRANVDSLFALYVIVSILKIVLFYFFLKKRHLLLGKVQSFRISAPRIIKESWPYFVLVLLMLPFSALSNNFLALNAKPEQLGYFNLSQRLLGPVSIIIEVGFAAIFPNLSSLWAKDEDQFYGYISIGFKYFMMLALVLCFLFALFAQDIVKLLFSAKYLPAVKISQLQIWYTFLATVDSLIGFILSAINKDKVILKFGIYKAIFCTPFLYIGSMYGALGLSYGYVISLALFNIYLWIGFKRALNSRISKVAVLWVFSAALFLVSYFLPANIFVIRVIIALAAMGFTGYYIAKNYKTALV
jgi:O-antigen/teichoic acid export membrane protein